MIRNPHLHYQSLVNSPRPPFRPPCGEQKLQKRFDCKETASEMYESFIQLPPESKAKLIHKTCGFDLLSVCQFHVCLG